MLIINPEDRHCHHLHLLMRKLRQRVLSLPRVPTLLGDRVKI